MTATLHAFRPLPDLRPYQGPEPDFLRDWLGRRAQNEWKAQATAQAIIKAAKLRMAQIEARRAAQGRG